MQSETHLESDLQSIIHLSRTWAQPFEHLSAMATSWVNGDRSFYLLRTFYSIIETSLIPAYIFTLLIESSCNQTTIISLIDMTILDNHIIWWPSLLTVHNSVLTQNWRKLTSLFYKLYLNGTLSRNEWSYIQWPYDTILFGKSFETIRTNEFRRRILCSIWLERRVSL